MKERIKHACVAMALALGSIGGRAADDKLGVSVSSPSLSPTGTHLVFAADFDGRFRIWRSAIDGSDLMAISTAYETGSDSVHMEPAWSPDGRSIAMVVDNGSTSDIWILPAGGGQAVRLTANAGANVQPSWSPDSRRIVFVSDRAGTKDIWVMNANGGQQTRLTSSGGQENNPRFSPVGDRIIYSESINDAAVLKVVGSSGGASSVLLPGSFRDYEPFWGVRGIVFSSNRDGTGRWKLYAVNADGTGLRKLGDQPGHDPQWMPDGRILFTDEPRDSRAISSISALSPATGGKQIVVDVQGYLTPIDIRPNKRINHVNPQSRGKIPVAILSSASFDAVKMVDQQTLSFGRTGRELSLSSCSKPAKDVNGDGIPDLVCRFDTRRAGFTHASTFGVLRFMDAQGVPYEGRDAITIVQTEDPEDLRE